MSGTHNANRMLGAPCAAGLTACCLLERDAGGNRTHFHCVADSCLAIWLQRLTRIRNAEVGTRNFAMRTQYCTPKTSHRKPKPVPCELYPFNFSELQAPGSNRATDLMKVSLTTSQPAVSREGIEPPTPDGTCFTDRPGNQSPNRLRVT